MSGALEPDQRHAAYLDVSEEAGRAFFMRGIRGSVVMLNLLRLRAQADYSATPNLAPPEPIDGATAYKRYMEHTTAALEDSRLLPLIEDLI